MAWFKIDDGFHCHPKVFAAGTPAVGLYVRCGSWAAQQTTDGIVPKQIAKLYGTPRMIKALIDAGLWHQKGHDCESCPKLDANSYAIHQYLERNASRVEVELARKAKSERQQRWREGKRKQQVNGEGTPDVDGDVDASTPRHGDAAPIPSHPIPSQVPPTEVPPPPPPSTDKPTAEDAPAPAAEEDGLRTVQPLIDEMTRRGMRISWSLQTSDWKTLAQLVRTRSVPVLVDHAERVWRSAKSTPYSARYFLAGWSSIPETPADASPTLRAVPGATGPMSPAAEYLADMQAIAAELAQRRTAGGA